MTTAEDTGQRIDLSTEDRTATTRERLHPFESAALTENITAASTTGPSSTSGERVRPLPFATKDGAPPVDISVVVPVYNEEDCLPELHRRLTRVMQSTGRRYEIIFVDDGSDDGSLSLMREFSRQDPNTRYLSLTRNFGQTVAIAAGQVASRGLGVITIDSDLQNPPEEIPKLLAKFDEGYEVVYGIRNDRQDPWLRRVGSSIVTRLLRASMRLPVQLSLTAFMVVHRRFVEELNHCPERTRFHPALCAWLGAKTAHVDVRHEMRFHGKSKYDYWRLIKTSLDLFTGYTQVPLRLASWAGLLFSAVGFAMACWAVFQKLVNDGTLLGWASILGAVSMLGGVQLLAIGAVGVYLGRAYMQLLGRPLYVIRETDGTAQDRGVWELPRNEVGSVRPPGRTSGRHEYDPGAAKDVVLPPQPSPKQSEVKPVSVASDLPVGCHDCSVRPPGRTS